MDAFVLFSFALLLVVWWVFEGGCRSDGEMQINGALKSAGRRSGGEAGCEASYMRRFGRTAGNRDCSKDGRNLPTVAEIGFACRRKGGDCVEDEAECFLTFGRTPQT